jgi:hypothetical protein
VRRDPTNIASTKHEEGKDEVQSLEVHFTFITTLGSDSGELRCYKNVISSVESEIWIKASNEEIGNFFKRDV